MLRKLSSCVVIGICALTTGCAERPVSIQVVRARPYAPPVSLGLARTADETRAAEDWAGRRAWPTVDAGYRLDDVTYFTEVVYDDQAFYDVQGGGLLHSTQTVRTGVLVR